MGLSTVLATVLDMVSMEVVMKLVIYSKKKEMMEEGSQSDDFLMFNADLTLLGCWELVTPL